ncbi:MAG: ribose-phosphate pyrophosphokinase [Betaproteobacteria bacterium]|nr:ribose-phosphate pyrophosphokinase [Betaproteobacteria bacterium]
MIVHANHPEHGDLRWRRFEFPDGQPHCAFDAQALAACTGPVEIVTAVRAAGDVVWAALLVDALRSGLPRDCALHLNIGYLLGARMDRRIGPGQPATLAVIAAQLRALQPMLGALRVLDPHSPATLEQLPGVEVLVPDPLVAYALRRLSGEEGSAPVVVVPDAGARGRTLGVLRRLGIDAPLALCSKQRDPNTGKLSAFRLDEGVVAGRRALIVDDICDGGGTFTGLARLLRVHGAAEVHLCVTHGLLTKGWALEGIDRIFTTDSAGMPGTAGLALHTDAHDPRHLDGTADDKVRLSVLTRFVESLVQDLPA